MSELNYAMGGSAAVCGRPASQGGFSGHPIETAAEAAAGVKLPEFPRFDHGRAGRKAYQCPHSPICWCAAPGEDKQATGEHVVVGVPRQERRFTCGPALRADPGASFGARGTTLKGPRAMGSRCCRNDEARL
jgi:hypothetical protein